MKKICTILIFSLAVFSLNAQTTTDDSKNNDKPKKVKVTPYGFVRNYFNYDSRKTYTVIGGEYNMIPYDEKWNGTEAECLANGIERVDLNATPSAQLLAITTRIGLNLEGPDVLGAATSGKIEADFGGFSTTNNVLRIRQAFFKLNWNKENGIKHELLAGQTWHPLSGDIMPECLGMAVGAPFRPHSRTPQLRYIFTDGNFGFTAAALYQLQYMYNGPSYSDGKWSSTNSLEFGRNAILPEVFLGLNFRNSNIYAQLGSTCQPIRPRNFGYNDNGKAYSVDELLFTFTPTLYFQYVEGMFSVKCRTMLAQNTSHVNQLNGFGVTAVNPDGSWDYAPIKASISYVDFAVGKKYRANLFFGYQKNLGADNDLYNFGTDDKPNYYIYLKGANNFTHLNSIFRIAPSVSYNLKHFNFGIEYEWTACTYGDIDKNGGIVDNDNLHQVANNRICVLMKYNF